jgi:hypothetical protein
MKKLIFTVIALCFLCSPVFAFAWGDNSSDDSGRVRYKDQDRSQKKERQNRGAIDPNSGRYYPPAGRGAVDTRDGTYYTPVRGGYIDTQTGQFVPAR